jgi:hypothetical protein
VLQQRNVIMNKMRLVAAAVAMLSAMQAHCAMLEGFENPEVWREK